LTAVRLSDGTVTLREWREDDAAAVFEACQDPEILHWIPVISRPYTMEHALDYVRGGMGPNQFAVELGGRVVGAVGVKVDEARGTAQAGYWCVKDARGQGTIPRALRLLCRHAHSRLGVVRIEMVIDPDNRASQRVAEKVGFRREGVLRSHLRHPDGRRRDSVMFSLLPGEESAARGRNE
jgi:RimJ/RimL family protein N-acetyltransferase